MQRQRFSFSTDTGTETLTGASFSGAIRQIGWNPSVADTGSSQLDVILCPAAGDTAGGFVIFSKATSGGLASAFLRALVLQTSNAADVDTGVDSSYPPVGAGDHLVARVTPHGAALAGDLFAWIDDGC